jgi:hypothetical protein
MAKVLCVLYDDPVDAALLQRCQPYRRLGGGGTVQGIDRRWWPLQPTLDAPSVGRQRSHGMTTQRTVRIGATVGMGMVIGAVIGHVLGQVALGVGVGALVGMGIGSWLQYR